MIHKIPPKYGNELIYLYGNIFRGKFFTPENSYKITEEDQVILAKSSTLENVACLGIKIDNFITLFKNGKIFNTFLINGNNGENGFYSFDQKTVVLKNYNKKLNSHRIYTVKVIKEEENSREVEILDKSSSVPIPGVKLKGRIFYKGNEKVPSVHTSFGDGCIILQTNKLYEENEEVSCVLWSSSADLLKFAEVDAPIKKIEVKVKNTSNGLHWVENKNVRGVLKETTRTRDKKSLFVRVDAVRVGSYVFKEALIDLYKDICIRIVSYNVTNKFYYARIAGSNEKIKVVIENNTKKVMRGQLIKYENEIYTFKQSESELQGASEERKDAFYREEEQLKKELEEAENKLAVFLKYEHLFVKSENILYLYLLYLSDNNLLEIEEVRKYINSKRANKILEIENVDLIKYIFNKSKTKKSLFKLLNMGEQVELSNLQLKEFYIEYALKHDREDLLEKVKGDKNYMKLIGKKRIKK
ncbi:hypothetical protein NUSPORA_00478 [Nucleospora cyclopteri]